MANKLKAGEQFKLNTWLNDNWDQYVTEGGKTTKEVARIASATFNFEITPANVKGAAVAIGKAFPRPKGAGGGTFIGRDDLSAICLAILHLHDWIRKVNPNTKTVLPIEIVDRIKSIRDRLRTETTE